MFRRPALSTLILTLTLLTSLLAPGQQALASYPGHNGRLAFGMNVDGNIDIYTALPNGHSLQRLTTQPGWDACADYSPDGKYIAYCSDQSGAFEIWTMLANGTQKTQVTHINGFATFPDFSPDGTRIVFDVNVPGSPTADIYVINTDGTGLTRLTDSPADDFNSAWSQDGTRIAFLSTRTGIGQVWVMDADGSNQHALTTDPNNKDQLPDWSPDGRRIAYESDATGNEDIYVMNADGSGQTRLTSDPGFEFGPAWSPDGTQIAFVRVVGDSRPIYIVNADGSDAHALLPGTVQFVAGWQSRN